MNFKDIHIGKMIKTMVIEKDIDIARICSFFNLKELEINEMYSLKSLDSDLLLKWSKLLEYDFFRIYSHHLILFSPPNKKENNKQKKTTSLPQFRKNIYTQEIIDFILEKVLSGKMTKKEVIEQYRIPKTTLYKWIQKYKI